MSYGERLRFLLTGMTDDERREQAHQEWLKENPEQKLLDELNNKNPSGIGEITCERHGVTLECTNEFLAFDRKHLNRLCPECLKEKPNDHHD